MKERTIPDILKDFQKVELEDLGSLLGNEMSPRLKKADLVKRLSDYLVRHPKRWLSHLMERDIRLLRSLVHSGPGKVQYLERADYPSLLEISGLVDSDDSDDRYQKVWVRREVYDIVAPHIDQVIRNGEKTGRFEVERVGLGYLNLYGIISVERFVDLMTDYYEAAFGPDFESLVRLLEESPLVKLYRYTDRHGDYLVSPCLGDAEEIFLIRDELSLESDKAFSVEDALEAGAGAPYFTVGLKTPEGRAMTDALQRIGYEGFDLLRAQHDIWVEAQYPYDNEALFAPLADKDETIPSDSLYYGCMDAIIDYANAVPKWALNGFSALEKDYLILEYPPEEGAAEETSAPREEAYPEWSMPRPSISEGYTDLIETDDALDRLSGLMPEGFPFGMAIPHVAPTDPCPCGSGLRYCHCHGKMLN